ncbi:MAG: hypothetical protein LBR61_07080 [Synergistaceae bacterium]|jgi:hypothetical protein|nr:hypothetical protein [Synergistaceae bacterium]
MYDGRSRFREPSFDALQCQIDEAFDKIRELRQSMDDFNDKNVVPNMSEKLQILSERINENKKC